MYKDFASLLSEAAEAKVPLWRIIAAEEMRLSEIGRWKPLLKRSAALSPVSQAVTQDTPRAAAVWLDALQTV